ncbi:MAG: LacI family transcriptional regulator [Microbacterium sp. 69-10]|uniref:LacI family DNA-binding transcriptional regulator n=1 Tax=Microbacterium sp. 69-10 TaxID=1895783 RepID=UPI00095A5F8C|nr:LacI family DNA-binding transcriptional regulator [Microbacterium sp. 69-10]OJU39005.1 MAG: LacI family transcriptional regulator [Microbacterium sp. 69-10]
MSTSPTMNDVARAAGVALKTVSRYVNGETNINPLLAERIGAAIVELGYRRNLAAASIRPGWTSKMLGLVISDLSNPYYSALTQSIEQTARSQGYLLISASSEEDGATFDRLVDRLMEQRVDGLIVVPPKSPARPWSAVVPPIPPLVVLDRPMETADLSADIILADNAGGARDAVKALLDEGARRVAFVGDSLELYTMRERYEGYQEALRAQGLPIDERLIATDAHNYEQATTSVLRLIGRTGSAGPDAIFAANNRAAIGTLLAFRQRGQRLPLIAFDDFEAAKVSDPAVSVVTQSIQEMGRIAAERVIARAAGESSAGTTTVLPTTLVLRGSETPARPGASA